MHKDYINNQNTPRLKLYTYLLFFFYLFTGVNFIFTASSNCENNATVLRALILIGILFIILAPIAILDKRKENRSIGAVVASAVVHFLCTVLCSVMFYFAQVYIVYLVELAICLLCVVRHRIKTRS